MIPHKCFCVWDILSILSYPALAAGVCPLPQFLSTPDTCAEPGIAPSSASANTHPTPSISSDSRTDSPSGTDPSHVPELLSFSEWKARHEASRGPSYNPSDSTGRHTLSFFPSPDDAPLRATLGANLQPNSPGSSVPTPTPAHKTAVTQSAELSTQTRSYIHPLPDVGSDLPSDPLLSLKSRTNYASLDCSASIHYSSPQTRFASAILASSKDRYMLTPCKSGETSVVIELCDEIEIDTIVLANHEFFSSMFKVFRISSAQAYADVTAKDGPWTDLGTFRAGNTRDLQVFHTKPTTGFFRYLRIDFLSHYGSEHFCPISLFRVYGLNQLDSWRRDQARERLEAEMFARAEEIHQDISNGMVFEDDDSADEQNSEVSSTFSIFTDDVEPGISTEEVLATTQELPSTPTAHTSPSQFDYVGDSSPSIANSPSVQSPEGTTFVSEPSATRSSITPASDLLSQSQLIPEITATDRSDGTALEDINFCTLPPKIFPVFVEDLFCSIDEPQSAVTEDDTYTSTTTSLGSTMTSSVSVTGSSLNSSSDEQPLNTTRVYFDPPQPHKDHRTNGHPASGVNIPSGESIYGSIMKRLAALEKNVNLSVTFAEEQGALLRNAFINMENRLGDLESQKIKQDQMLRRIILDMDLHRAKVEQDRIALASQVNLLSGEIIFSRRLGIAQLAGLFGLFVFVGLTRASPSSPFMDFALPPEGNPAQRRSDADEHEFVKKGGSERRERERHGPYPMSRSLSYSKRSSSHRGTSSKKAATSGNGVSPSTEMTPAGKLKFGSSPTGLHNKKWRPMTPPPRLVESGSPSPSDLRKRKQGQYAHLADTFDPSTSQSPNIPPFPSSSLSSSTSSPHRLRMSKNETFESTNHSEYVTDSSDVTTQQDDPPESPFSPQRSINHSIPYSPPPTSSSNYSSTDEF